MPEISLLQTLLWDLVDQTWTFQMIGLMYVRAMWVHCLIFFNLSSRTSKFLSCLLDIDVCGKVKFFFLNDEGRNGFVPWYFSKRCIDHDEMLDCI
jgi:hypothetical protein